MSSSPKTLVALTVVSIALGCGGGDGGSSGSVPLNQFAVELSRATCAKAIECCTSSELMEKVLGATDQASCESTFSIFLTLVSAELQQSVNMMRAKYHPDRAGACIAALKRTSCAEFSSQSDSIAPAGCENYVEPLIAAGGACSQNAECKTGACVGAANGMDGTCGMFPGTGAPCVFDCAEGLTCDFSTSTCIPLRANGTACEFPDECASGNCTNMLCAVDTSCDGK